MKDIREVNFFKTNSTKLMPLDGSVSVNATNGKTFQDTLVDIIGEMNEITNKPKQMTQDMMLGKADAHDVMAAIAQSELAVQTATTLTSKILQTYEKVMQIQI